MSRQPSFCTVPAENCPFAAPPIRRTRLARWRNSLAVAIGFGVMVGCFMIGVGYAIYSSSKPPIIVQNSAILDVPIHEDGELQFIVKSMIPIDRPCTGSVTREFWRYVDYHNEMVPDRWRNGGPAPIIEPASGGTYIIHVPLPPHMPPGHFIFRGETTYECGYLWALLKDFPRGFMSGLTNGGNERVRTLDMPFTILGR